VYFAMDEIYETGAGQSLHAELTLGIADTTGGEATRADARPSWVRVRESSRRRRSWRGSPDLELRRAVRLRRPPAPR
jgi:hypothetical protein